MHLCVNKNINVCVCIRKIRRLFDNYHIKKIVLRERYYF